jgi:hypothetical protein
MNHSKVNMYKGGLGVTSEELKKSKKILKLVAVLLLSQLLLVHPLLL